MDYLNYTFTGHIDAILTDMPFNKHSGLKKMYRIGRSGNITVPGYHGNNIEPGYSGGPVFDKNGKVVAMTILLTPGFVFSHVISGTDLKIFLQNLKNKSPHS